MPKIVVIGPESTGKSTLCEDLAKHFCVAFVPEYAREYLKQKGTNYELKDVENIAKGQLRLEDEHTEKLQILDTNLYVHKVWLEEKYNTRIDWIEQEIFERKYDHYLLCNIDLPWQTDPLREHPSLIDRQRLFNRYYELLLQDGTPFSLISGNREERFNLALQLVQKTL